MTARPRSSHGTPPGEPVKTIYQGDLSHAASWRKAKARLAEMEPGPEREAISALLASIEAGWAQVRELQLMYEARPPEEKRGPLGHLLAFIDSDVVDLYRSVAHDCALLVPGPTGLLLVPADLDSTEGEADRFDRYLAVLGLAASDAAIPPQVRETVRAVAQRLAGWYGAFLPQLEKVGGFVPDPE